jgi:hypothetical protein
LCCFSVADFWILEAVTVAHALVLQPGAVHGVLVPGHEQFLVARFADVFDAKGPVDTLCFFDFVIAPRPVRGCCHECEQSAPDAAWTLGDARAAGVFLAQSHAIWWQHFAAPRHDSQVEKQSFGRLPLFHEMLLARIPEHCYYDDLVSGSASEHNLRARHILDDRSWLSTDHHWYLGSR